MKRQKQIKPGKVDDLRLRMVKVKAMFPFSDYTPVYLYEYGDDKATWSEEHLNDVRMVWNLRKVDEKITSRFEAILEKLKLS